jgi:hypothetical protein
MLLAYLLTSLGVPQPMIANGAINSSCRCGNGQSNGICCCSAKKVATTVTSAQKSCCSKKAVSSCCSTSKSGQPVAAASNSCHQRDLTKPNQNSKDKDSRPTVAACPCGSTPMHAALVHCEPHIAGGSYTAFDVGNSGDWLQISTTSSPTQSLSPETPPPRA